MILSERDGNPSNEQVQRNPMRGSRHAFPSREPLHKNWMLARRFTPHFRGPLDQKMPIAPGILSANDPRVPEHYVDPIVDAQDIQTGN